MSSEWIGLELGVGIELAYSVWFPGLFLLIAGVFLTRRFWRPDVLPYQYQSLYVRGFDILLHPGRYTYPPAARIIRILNLAGVLLLAIGLAAVFYGIAQSSTPTEALGRSLPALLP